MPCLCRAECAARQIGSLVQVFEQPVPSPLKRPLGPVQPRGNVVGSVPQSQASPASLMPLPQMAVVHIPAAGAPDAVVGQVEAGSTWQVRRAAVTVGRVAVVARLAAFDDAIAANRDAGLPRHGATPAGLDRQAVGRAAVAADLVPVVAGLGRA